MMGRSPRCYIPSFVEIDLPAPEKKIFEGFFTIYGHGGPDAANKFRSPYQRRLHIKFGFDQASGFREEDL